MTNAIAKLPGPQTFTVVVTLTKFGPKLTVVMPDGTSMAMASMALRLGDQTGVATAMAKAADLVERRFVEALDDLNAGKEG